VKIILNKKFFGGELFLLQQKRAGDPSFIK